MSVSGCKNHYESVLGVGAKAKSVTNNLPILSVLSVGFIYCLAFDLTVEKEATVALHEICLFIKECDTHYGRLQ